ncbi:hypothetical protein U1Q18_004606 [Sarracenia purpurea var. burkii]
MSAGHNSVETVNAAATAIVTAESRVQPTAVHHGKRIRHAVLVPESIVSGAAAPVTESSTSSIAILLPFIAPPSSPASFLQSDPPSATQSPAGTLSLASLSVNAYSLSGPASIFAVGPYAHETQIVSPPVFSTFTTEPSTASFTPPPEPIQSTTPSSPEVPFAQLLTSSLGRARRKPYFLYQGSPVSHLVSPGSVVSNSGTSSPFPDKPHIIFCIDKVPKLLGFEHFSTRKWGSRLGSGSLTPDGIEPVSRDSFLLENQISEVASLANSESGSQNEDFVIDRRVSFELTGEEAKSCPEKDLVSAFNKKLESECSNRGEAIWEKTAYSSEYCVGEALNVLPNKTYGEGEEELCPQKHRSISLGSIKEFNFNNTKGEVLDKPTVISEWWANEKVVGEELGSHDNWTFFPMLQPGVS